MEEVWTRGSTAVMIPRQVERGKPVALGRHQGSGERTPRRDIGRGPTEPFLHDMTHRGSPTTQRGTEGGTIVRWIDEGDREEKRTGSRFHRRAKPRPCERQIRHEDGTVGNESRNAFRKVFVMKCVGWSQKAPAGANRNLLESSPSCSISLSPWPSPRFWPSSAASRSGYTGRAPWRQRPFPSAIPTPGTRSALGADPRPKASEPER